MSDHHHFDYSLHYLIVRQFGRWLAAWVAEHRERGFLNVFVHLLSSSSIRSQSEGS